MREIIVTVFTPSYNKPYYVREAINSVLTQTLTNFEYIIVDNSTDMETKKVIKAFSDTRIRYVDEVFSKQKRADFYVPAYLVNKYYPQARGKYIIFLADDDVLLPNCLKSMSDYLESNTNADVCYHDQIIIYSIENKRFTESLARGSDKIFEYPKKPSPAHSLDGGQVMFKKVLLNDITSPIMPTEWSTANICDKIFLNKLWEKHPFYPVKKILSIKRVVTSSTHRKRSRLKFQLFYLAVRIVPKPIQILLGLITRKRRNIRINEKIELLNNLKHLDIQIKQ